LKRKGNKTGKKRKLVENLNPFSFRETSRGEGRGKLIKEIRLPFLMGINNVRDE